MYRTRLPQMFWVADLKPMSERPFVAASRFGPAAVDQSADAHFSDGVEGAASLITSSQPHCAQRLAIDILRSTGLSWRNNIRRRVAAGQN